MRDFGMGDLSKMGVDLSRPGRVVLELPAQTDERGDLGHSLTTAPESETGQTNPNSGN